MNLRPQQRIWGQSWICWPCSVFSIYDCPLGIIIACRKHPGPSLVIDDILFVHPECCWLDIVPATWREIEKLNLKWLLSPEPRCKKLWVGWTEQIVHHLSEMSLSEFHMSYLLQVYWISRTNTKGKMQCNLRSSSFFSLTRYLKSGGSRTNKGIFGLSVRCIFFAKIEKRGKKRKWISDLLSCHAINFSTFSRLYYVSSASIYRLCIYFSFLVSKEGQAYLYSMQLHSGPVRGDSSLIMWSSVGNSDTEIGKHWWIEIERIRKVR